MSLLFNILPRFAIAFLPRSKSLLILWLQLPSAMILEPKKIKSAIFSTFPPSISHEVMGLDVLILAFWMLSFKPPFSLSSFTLIKTLISSSLLSAIRVVSSAYLQSLIFLPEILIPVGPLLDRNLVVRSQWWDSERRKEANIPWVTQPAFVLQGISQN